MEYQGIVPPTERSEMDFDPAAKAHISADVPYVKVIDFDPAAEAHIPADIPYVR